MPRAQGLAFAPLPSSYQPTSQKPPEITMIGSWLADSYPAWSRPFPRLVNILQNPCFSSGSHCIVDLFMDLPLSLSFSLSLSVSPLPKNI